MRVRVFRLHEEVWEASCGPALIGVYQTWEKAMNAACEHLRMCITSLVKT